MSESQSDRRTEPMDPAVKAAIRVGKAHRRKYMPDRDQVERMARCG